jgi:hypothetical protein
MVNSGAMTSAQAHSLWIVPHGAAGARLGEIIRSLSHRYGTPSFPPHLTLLAHIPQSQSELVARTRKLAAELTRFDIELAEPAFTADYFRSLFIKAVPDVTLQAAHRRARELFEISPQAYVPHLSLLYGELPAFEKEAIIARLGRDYPKSFTAEAVDVYLTEGPPEDWRPVESIVLD